MAWMELLPSLGVDPDTVGEMDKDVKRLSMIASRFGGLEAVTRYAFAGVGHVNHGIASVVSESYGYASVTVNGVHRIF